MFEGGLCGIMDSYVISPLWSLGGGIACDAQQGSTLSPTGASEKIGVLQGVHTVQVTKKLMEVVISWCEGGQT